MEDCMGMIGGELAWKMVLLQDIQLIIALTRWHCFLWGWMRWCTIRGKWSNCVNPRLPWVLSKQKSLICLLRSIHLKEWRWFFGQPLWILCLGLIILTRGIFPFQIFMWKVREESVDPLFIHCISAHYLVFLTFSLLPPVGLCYAFRSLEEVWPLGLFPNKGQVGVWCHLPLLGTFVRRKI